MKNHRERLPDDREGVTHRFRITDRNGDVVAGYLQLGLYADGRPGELFLKMGKPGCETAVYDMWALAISMALQYGAPVDVLFGKFRGQRYEPSGFTSSGEVSRCSSVVDYVARWVLRRYASAETDVGSESAESVGTDVGDE